MPCDAQSGVPGASSAMQCLRHCTGGQWHCAVPRVLCWWCHAVPKAWCHSTGSLCESEQGAAAAPFLLTRSQALLARFTFAMTGAATLALPSSP